MIPSATIDPEASLAHLATTHPAASRVFHRHGLDFCCGGKEPLAEACRRTGLDPLRVVEEIGREPSSEDERWDERALPELIEHLLTRYHAGHREELPRLIAMAEKVEQRHAEKATCPRGLAELLRRIEGELEDHMQKEEQVLFPLILAGRGRMAGMPILAMEAEHRDHAANLALLRERAGGFEAPAEACPTWQALYLGLRELELELMRHIHLENNVLFPRTLRA